MDNKALLIIFVTVFIDLVGFGMIIPLGPYLGRVYGASGLEIGLLMSVYSVAQFLVAPFWGQMSDKIGRRPILLMSLLGAAVSHTLFGWAGSLLGLFLARSFAGVFGANISTAMAYMADITDEKDRSKGMGLIGAAFGLGFVLGPGIGGFLAQWGPSVPAFAAGLICFLNFLVALKVLKEPVRVRKSSQASRHSGRFRRIFSHLKSPVVGPLILVSFLVSFSLANVEAPLFLFVKERFDWGLSQASWGFAYVGVVMAITQGWIIRKLLPRFGEFPLMLAGVGLFTLGLFLTGFTYLVFAMAVAMTFMALGSGLFTPSLNGSVSLYSSQDRQGEVMGVVQSLSALARILGPPLGGWMFDHWGSGAPFFVSSAVGGLGFIGLAVWKKLVSGKTKSASRAETVPTKAMVDPLYIGRFQLENLLSNEVPYVLINICTENQQDELTTSEGWEGLKWVFSRAQNLRPTEVRTWLEARHHEGPILILCHTGAQGPALALELEAAGFENIFVVEDGAKGLLDTH